MLVNCKNITNSTEIIKPKPKPPPPKIIYNAMDCGACIRETGNEWSKGGRYCLD